jgi:hypothetical protein
MTTSRKSLQVLLKIGAFVWLVFRANILCVAMAETADAQGIPRRSQVLQTYRPVADPPVSQVERLREDIIQATNPVTGTVNVRELRGPDLRGRPGSPYTGPQGAVSGPVLGSDQRGRLGGISSGTQSQGLVKPVLGQDARGRPGGN